ncbi:hypothetical protein GCM10011414_15860 [Croceivirga lutea]|uniref:IMPACT family protein n=1 Tax=Croceivirga lutea TaxID=1775167 RepID=UPI00163AE242|nr:YigZ family protein [Croceivirga lutea]GGG47034.1 hypothetical protein GCM10011414_15860 [Croceivirga lutea]
MEQKESFNTIKEASAEILFKERKSKFFGYAFPVSTQEEIKNALDLLRKKYPNANHVCYAWQLGVDNQIFRANDDGEPNNSAGMPIYGQIQSFNVTNILIAVVRIFGGTKLGVGGLIQAYKETAKLTLENCAIIEKVVEKQVSLKFGYNDLNSVMGILKRFDATMVSQHMEMECHIVANIAKKYKTDFTKAFENLHKVELQIMT